MSVLMSVIVLISILLLSSCGSTPKPDNKNLPSTADANPNLQEISKDITGLVNVDTLQAVGGSNAIYLSNNSNRYLAQQKQLLTGIAVDVLATFQQALMLMDQKKWQAADKKFDLVIAQYPDFSASYVNKALILTMMPTQKNTTVSSDKSLSENTSIENSLTKSSTIEHLIDKAIDVNQLNPYAHHFKGQIQQHKGLFVQAEQSYTTALSIWPNYKEAMLSKAILLELYQGKYIEAYQYYSAYLVPNKAQKNMEKSQHISQEKNTQVQRWIKALAIKIKRAGLTLPVNISQVKEQGNVTNVH